MVTETLPAMVPCQDHTPACHEQVVRELGAKFHREPLADTMVGPYTALMAGEASFDDALRQLVAAFVQSPFFLYRRELGEPEGVARRIASRCSSPSPTVGSRRPTRTRS